MVQCDQGCCDGGGEGEGSGEGYGGAGQRGGVGGMVAAGEVARASPGEGGDHDGQGAGEQDQGGAVGHGVSPSRHGGCCRGAEFCGSGVRRGSRGRR